MPTADNTTNRIKFTIGRVNSFECQAGRNETLLWDSDEKTLCIRARSSGSRSYYYQSRLNGKVIKLRIGSLSDKRWTIEDARIRAGAYQVMVSKGIDPRLEIKRTHEQEVVETAERAKKGVKVELLIHGYVAANRESWGQSHLNDYIRSTQKALRGRNGILYDLKDFRIEDLSSSELLEWVKVEKRYRPTAVAKGYRLLRACFYWANGQGKYKGIINVDELFNNSEIRKALPKPKAKHDSLQKQMLPLWFQAVRSMDNIAISACLQTLLLTGARREEILSLKWSDVDFKWLSLRISDKVEGERVIPLTPYVAQLLNNLPRRNEWVFSSPAAKSGRLQEPFKAHVRAMTSVDLPPISIHGLRRSFGTLSEWVECPVGIVAQIQGHKPSATAEKHYRVRPLDLLRLWHTKIEKQILEFAGVEQPIGELDDKMRLIKT